MNAEKSSVWNLLQKLNMECSRGVNQEMQYGFSEYLSLIIIIFDSTNLVDGRVL